LTTSVNSRRPSVHKRPWWRHCFWNGFPR